jgi:hypothetical protein
MFKKATICLFLCLSGLAQVDEETINQYTDYLPFEIMKMTGDQEESVQ